jgi:hypothetical protein
MRIISYGGGVQSTALCVLATQGKIGQIDAALFANVGDDSEHPATITYVREVMIPWAKERGLDVQELKRIKRTGEVETLWSKLMKPESKSVPIPIRMSETGTPGSRSCTADFKIGVIAKWLKARGASADAPAQVCIGFSLDEAHRASNKRTHPCELPEHPLLDLHLTRTDCKNIIARAGLPVPPKSACFFCPFHRPAMWAKMRRDEPALFQKSVDLENTINERRRARGRDQVYLTRFGKPLEDAIHARQADLPGLLDPDADSCDDGYCWT